MFKLRNCYVICLKYKHFFLNYLFPTIQISILINCFDTNLVFLFYFFPLKCMTQRKQNRCRKPSRKVARYYQRVLRKKMEPWLHRTEMQKKKKRTYIQQWTENGRIKLFQYDNCLFLKLQVYNVFIVDVWLLLLTKWAQHWHLVALDIHCNWFDTTE